MRGMCAHIRVCKLKTCLAKFRIHLVSATFTCCAPNRELAARAMAAEAEAAAKAAEAARAAALAEPAVPEVQQLNESPAAAPAPAARRNGPRART